MYLTLIYERNEYFAKKENATPERVSIFNDDQLSKFVRSTAKIVEFKNDVITTKIKNNEFLFYNKTFVVIIYKIGDFDKSEISRIRTDIRQLKIVK